MNENYLKALKYKKENDYEQSLKFLQKAVEDKHADSTNLIGEYYYLGLGVEKDIFRALEYFEEGIKLGSFDAMVNYATYHSTDGYNKNNQLLVEQNLRKPLSINNPKALTLMYFLYDKAIFYDKNEKLAMDYLMKAVELEHDDAIILYADKLLEIGNENKAISLLKKQSDNGFSQASRRLANIYMNSTKNYDLNNAIDYLHIAANQGDKEVYELLGFYYFNQHTKKDYKTAYDWFVKAEKLNQASSLYYLSKYHLEGIIFESDIQKGMDYLYKSARLGHPEAFNKLGIFHLSGVHVNKNIAEAIKQFEIAVKYQLPSAMYNLAQIFLNGEESYRDIERAISLLKESSDLDYNISQRALADLYFKGEAITQNYNFAFELYKTLAKKGDFYSQNQLGIMYFEGLGVDVNYEKAKEWFRKAKKNGSNEAVLNLKKYFY